MPDKGFFYRLLADLILITHFAYVLFIVGGVAVIWIGHARGWTFVRGPWFRFTHLAMMALVAIEAGIGMICPLTEWEGRLRAAGGEAVHEESFIGHWVHRLMFFDLSPAFFTVAYLGFLALILFTLWRVPPRKFRRPEK